MKKLLIYLLLLLFITTANLVVADNALKDIEKMWVSVVITGIDDISQNQVITDVELKLRLAGISIVEFSASEGDSIEVFIYGVFIPDINHYSFYIRIDINKSAEVRFTNSNTIHYRPIPVWWRFTVGLASKQEADRFIRGIVKDYMDEFLNDYLAANPK